MNDVEDFKQRLNIIHHKFDNIDMRQRMLQARQGKGVAYKHKVRNRIKHSMYSGEMPICVKPPTLCCSQIIMVNHLALDKKRLKVFCTEQPFKYCLLEPLKKHV